ncbi:MAG TPA: hypothetical protein C5S51_09195 [Methanosarcinaceae archaeon]|nr:hypothetical protein [Methanosarcinaceae archaeon]
MGKEKIERIVQELDAYVISPAIQPYLSIYGEDIKNPDEKCSVSLSISSDDDFDEIIKIINDFSTNIKKFVHGEITVKDLSEGDGDSRFIYKMMDAYDLQKTDDITHSNCAKYNVIDFLKFNKFKNVFLLIELNLNEDPEKKIILLKSITPNYIGKKNKFFLSKSFNNTQKIKFIDNKKDIILNSNFEIAIFISKSKTGELLEDSFIFIQKREKFEDLYGYHHQYDKAYSIISKTVNFIDWSKAEATLPLKRKCYSIANFERLEESINCLKNDLTSSTDNDIKKAFSSMGINYEIDKKGKLSILPDGTKELRALLKIIMDEVAKTSLLGRNVLGSNFEEIK